MEDLTLDGIGIGQASAPYYIAEIGSNHNGDMDVCTRMIDAAKGAGAHAVKFQSWSATSLISAAEYRRNTSYADTNRHFGSLKEMVERYQLTAEQHQFIAQYCADAGITFASSAFSEEEIRLLESLNVAFHKVASMDINNLRLLHAFGSTGKPILLSTGMATAHEIENALSVLREYGCPTVLLHCVSLYPPEDACVNVHNIDMLRDTYDVPVGFSDHTIDETAAIAAVARGACVIEKHFTIDRDMNGWDHWMSATPDIFGRMVRECTRAWKMMGAYERVLSPEELKKRVQFRRSAVARYPLKKGALLSEKDVVFKRAGIEDGIAPDAMANYVGGCLRQHIDTDEPIRVSDVSLENPVPHASL